MFERVDDRPLAQAVVGQGIEAVDGVDDGGDAGHTGCDPAVDARLRVVRVHEIRAPPLEHRSQLAERGRIVQRRHRTRRVPERDVRDAELLELVDIGTGRGHTNHFVPGAADGIELRTEQQHQADVGRGHVHDAGTESHAVAPR